MSQRDFHQKLNSNYYENNSEEFRHDALTAAGIADHPKSWKAYSLAWEFGHANGYYDIYYYLDEFAELLRD